MMSGTKRSEKTPRGKAGFTLVELLIVITIIVIMLSIMAVASGPIMHHVGIAQCQAQLKALAQVYLNYTNQYSTKFPPLQSPTEVNWTQNQGNVYSLSGGSSPGSGFDNLVYNGNGGGYGVGFGPLSWQQLVAARYYVCPSITDKDQWWH